MTRPGCLVIAYRGETGCGVQLGSGWIFYECMVTETC